MGLSVCRFPGGKRTTAVANTSVRPNGLWAFSLSDIFEYGGKSDADLTESVEALFVNTLYWYADSDIVVPKLTGAFVNASYQ